VGAQPDAAARHWNHPQCLFGRCLPWSAADVFLLRRESGAVQFVSQALQAELKLEHSPIRVTTVFPPAANTPFFSHAISYMGRPARPHGPSINRKWSQQRASGRLSSADDASDVDKWHFRSIPGSEPHGSGPDRLVHGPDGKRAPNDKDPKASQVLEPTLFEPSRRVFDIRGAVRTRRTDNKHPALAGESAYNGGDVFSSARRFSGEATRRSVASTPAPAEVD